MNLLLVGRHEPDFGNMDVNIVEQRRVTFPDNVEECKTFLFDLCRAASEMSAAVVMQNVPSQVAVALFELNTEGLSIAQLCNGFGVIVSKPGIRESGVQKIIECGEYWIAQQIAVAVQFVNPKANVEVDGNNITLTVDPPMKFEFSHIRWFF